ncbi:GNAT family N-acetyltransferase [Tissierella sp. MB52-C2]|uniref:bifunctional NUDIX hydrolase family protein/GNAT family N-acetyltransferase n=1 Tax=Tissierella sp. MB52-C2 TaxID=3070999 RepID=UPI00280B7EDA|nr:GNAT family N-acetyltransferase [Tissierella sp. MB52-C2]WMM23788.1 GNAT family N-acetyltransferase [Tissierella sp. MB52-C2]
MNKSLDKVLMIHHNIRNTWAWTGGHVDGDSDFLHVAIKEAKEETGINTFTALTNVKILARAYAYRDEISKALIICNDDEMIGLLFYREWQSSYYILDQFMIDERFQGMGYARTALELILNRMKEHGKYNHVKLCYCKGNEAAVSLFTSLGFYHTYEEDDDEIIMALDF